MTQNQNAKTHVQGWTDSQQRQWALLYTYLETDGFITIIGFSISSQDGQELTQQVLREIPFKRYELPWKKTEIRERRKLWLESQKYAFEPGEARHRGFDPLSVREKELTRQYFLSLSKNKWATIRPIAQRFGISESAAKKRIANLRREGLLPPSKKRKNPKINK